MKERKSETTEDVLYRIGLVSIIVMGIGILILKRYSGFFMRFTFPCAFRMMTGYYCPGCGGTRAVKFFLQGHIIKSFLYHPLIPYLGIGGGVFMLSQTLSRITKGKAHGMKFKNWYVYMMGVIIIVQFLVKNILLCWKGIHII